MALSGVRASAPTEIKFDLLQGALAIDGAAIGFWGARGLRHVYLGEGRCFDLTCGLGGADRLFLRGASIGYRVDVRRSDVLVLRHPALQTEVRLHASRGPCELVFDDGWVGLGDLWRSVRQASALLDVVGERTSCAAASVAHHVAAGPGRACAALAAGALIQLEGAAGVETVYGPGAVVCLGARLSEHRAHLAGGVLALSRRASGWLEASYLAGPARLVCADGSVDAGALSRAVQRNDPWPAPEGEAAPALPRITAVALDVDSGADGAEWLPDGWMTADGAGGALPGDLPSGLFGGCRAGQVLEASVSLDEAVVVEGAPRLCLSVGGRGRSAHFSGGNGTDTLRFVYTVTDDDVSLACSSETKGLTLTGGAGNLDVEVGPVLTVGASIRPLRHLPPAPDAAAPAGEPEVRESDWVALISESERRLALALASLEGTSLAVAAPDGVVDVAIDWRLDVDLAGLEPADRREAEALADPVGG